MKLNEQEYQEMVELFVTSASDEKEEQEKMRKYIRQYAFTRFQEHFYLFLDLKQETKDRIRAIRVLTKEALRGKK